MTSSNGNIFGLLAICAGNSTVPGEFPTQRPVTRSFDVFFDLRLNKRLSKQSWGWWIETLSHPLWRHIEFGDVPSSRIYFLSFFYCRSVKVIFFCLVYWFQTHFSIGTFVDISIYMSIKYWIKCFSQEQKVPHIHCEYRQILASFWSSVIKRPSKTRHCIWYTMISTSEHT